MTRALLATLLLAGPAAAADLSKLELGDDILGKKPETDGLKGKVLLVQMWGVDDPWSLPVLPRAAAWSEELSDFGLVVVGMHRRDATADEIKRVATAYGVRFPVVQGGFYDGGAGDIIPRTIVFGHTGECVYEGSAARAEAKIRQAVGAALVADVPDPPRGVASVAAALEKGGSPTDALRRLNTLKHDPDAKTAAAARAIVGRILSVAEKRLADAKATAGEEPVTAYDAAQRTAVRWKGFPVGTQAAELAAKLKQDKAVAGELKVRPQLETVRKIDAEITARVGTALVGPAEMKRTFAAELKRIGSAVSQMRKSAADAPATKEAEEIAKRYGVAVK